jgi:hypothetical protein
LFHYSKEAGSTPGPPPLRNQPQYSSLAVLSRDDSVSYKVEGSGSGSGSSVRGAALMREEDESAVSDLEDREAAEMALALAQIERLESGMPMEAENDVKEAEIAKKKEKKKVLKKSTAAGPVDGWGSAFKAVGIGAPSKKPGKGLSLAKPFKKVSSSTSADSIMGLGLDVKEAAVAPSRSFDDLKQMGRLHRDYGDQLQYSEKTSDSTDYTRKEREREIQKAFCADDFPALNMIPPVPVPGSAIGLSYHRKNDKTSSSTADSSFAGNAPPPPPGLSVEQRNENIRAFVAESKLRQAASSSSLSSLDHLGGNGDGARADPSNGSIQGSGNWTKMGGVTVPPSASASASSDYPALGTEYQNYTSATPFSISDSEYPSLGPGPGSSISGANKKDSKGRTNYSAAAALSGNGSALVSTKSSEDFLAAKKEKVAKKMSAQIQELSLK